MRQLTPREFPPLLREIPDPPERLWVRGDLPDPEQFAYLAVVGSRKHSPYGREVCEELIGGLRGAPVVIVSGLALGLDAIAHRAALAAGLPTIAIPGSGLDERVLYPAAHRGLAEDIVKHGGALLSEFPPDFKPRPESFPQRNRIMAGLSQAVLVAEAAERSGSLITARLATEYNRDVLAVPGSILTPHSSGTNMLIALGAALVRGAEDILQALGIVHDTSYTTGGAHADLTENERVVLKLLEEPKPRDEVVAALDMQTHQANTLIVELELKGLVKERLGLLHRN